MVGGGSRRGTESARRSESEVITSCAARIGAPMRDRSAWRVTRRSGRRGSSTREESSGIGIRYPDTRAESDSRHRGNSTAAASGEYTQPRTTTTSVSDAACSSGEEVDAGRALADATGGDLLHIVPKAPGDGDPPAAHRARIRRRHVPQRHRGLRQPVHQDGIEGRTLTMPAQLPRAEPDEEHRAGQRDEETEQGAEAHARLDGCRGDGGAPSRLARDRTKSNAPRS